MKKMLLSAALVMAAFTANAQVEATATSAKAINLTDVESLVPAGTEIGKTASVTAKTICEINHKAVGMKKGTVSINGTALTIADGDAIQGGDGTNGPGAAAAGTAYPEGVNFCGYEFTPSQHGYVYLIISGSANKNYVVYENGLDRVPYIYASEDVTDASPDVTVFAYDLMKIEGATYNLDGAIYVDPEYVGESVKSDGNGVIKFEVFEGCTYQAFATGSKMTIGGFAFDTTGDATITTDNGNTLLDKGQVPGNGGGTGIAGVEVKEEVDANAPVYNIAGQRVSKDAKGLVIVNGKKYLRK